MPPSCHPHTHICRSTLPRGATGGDSWLEHRGKPCGPPPEASQGRKGLSELLQHTSCPTQDGKGALGDAWLQAKGKQKVPGECLVAFLGCVLATVMYQLW